MGLNIEHLARATCDRCGSTSLSSLNNAKEPVINRLKVDSINGNNMVITEIDKIETYICDDCWNDLLDFINYYKDNKGV